MTQSRCMHSGSYSKISIPSQLHDIVKFQKYWKKSAKLLIKESLLKDFFIATGTSETPKKRLINKKVMSNWSWPVLLIDKISTSCFSGTRSHRRLIFRIWSLIGCTLCVLRMKTIESDSFFECVISHGMTQIQNSKYVHDFLSKLVRIYYHYFQTEIIILFQYRGSIIADSHQNFLWLYYSMSFWYNLGLIIFRFMSIKFNSCYDKFARVSMYNISLHIIFFIIINW